MRSYVLIFLIVHAASATIDLQQLKENAVTKLQTLQEAAATRIDALREKATSTVEQLTDSIDLKKIQKYDVLELLPKIEFAGKFVEQKIQGIPEQTKKIKDYLQSLKGLTGKDLALAFDGDVPWVAKRRMVLDDGEY